MDSLKGPRPILIWIVTEAQMLYIYVYLLHFDLTNFHPVHNMGPSLV